MKKLKQTVTAGFIITAMTLPVILSTTAQAETRRVGNVSWQMSNKFELTPTDQIPSDVSQLVFIRFGDSLEDDDNINISIDNHHQINLLASRVSKVFVCSGQHQVRSQAINHYSNRLMMDNKLINTMSQTTHFYQVLHNNSGTISILPLAPNTRIHGKSLESYITNMYSPSHQLSRIPASCGI